MTCSFRRGLLSLVTLGALGLVVVACTKSEAAPSQNKPTPMAEGTGAAAARVETETYVAYVRPAGEFTKDSEGTVEVVLEAKSDYHINEQYPYKVTPRESDGVKYAKEKFGREDGTFEATKAVIRVKFTPTRSGEVKVGGKFALSICSDKQCLMEKKDLELSLLAK